MSNKCPQFTRHFFIRDFQLVNVTGQHVDAACQFLYKGFMISASTIGISQGSCQNPVAIYGGRNYQKHMCDVCGPVAEAIDIIDKNSQTPAWASFTGFIDNWASFTGFNDKS